MRAAYIAVLIGVLVVCCVAGRHSHTPAGIEETNMPDIATLNRNVFGDQQNSSRLPVSGTIQGNEVWFRESLLEPGGGRSPIHLGLHGQLLFVSYGDLVAVLDRNDGSVNWTRQVRSNYASTITDDGIVTLDHVGYFVLLGYDGQPAAEKPLTGVNQNAQLHFIRDLERETIYSSQAYPKPTNAPGQTMEIPPFQFMRYIAERREVIWRYRIDGIGRGTLITGDNKRLYMFTTNRLYAFPVDAESDEQVSMVEFDSISSFSLDADGKALVVDIVENITQLKQVTPDGEVGWMVSFEQGQPSNQPPASSPEGYVYVVVGSDLHQIHDGEIVWTYPLPASVDDIAITVLANNSVLAAAGTALVHVSATGEEILTKWLDTPIGTRPIMDENGTVYYGGSDGIHCLR